MTKKFWTSLVFGLILVSPALMVGCGEETTKTDSKSDVVVPVTPVTPVTTPGEGAKATTTTTTTPATTTPAPVK